MIYQIDLAGYLDRRHAARFEEFECTYRPDGTTRLSGPLADQAALFGLLLRLRDLGIPLLRIEGLTLPPASRPPRRRTS